MKTYHKPTHKRPLLERWANNVDAITCPECKQVTDKWVFDPRSGQIICVACEREKARRSELIPATVAEALARAKARMQERRLAERIDRDATRRGISSERKHIIVQDGERLKYAKQPTLAHCRAVVERIHDKRTERVTLPDGSVAFRRLRDGEIIGTGPTAPVRIPTQQHTSSQAVGCTQTGLENVSLEDRRAASVARWERINRPAQTVDTTRRQENIADGLDMVQALMRQGVRAPHILARVAARLEQQGRALAEWRSSGLVSKVKNDGK